MRLANTRRLLTLASLVAALSLTTSRALADEKKEGKEENEVKVKLADVPAPVRATLDKESSGATLPEEVDKETEDGKPLYEADVKIAGKNYEIKVAEDGTLLSKKLEEDDDKDKKGEDDEKGEKHEKKEKDKD